MQGKLVENVQKIVQNPQARQQAKAEGDTWTIRVVLQLAFAVLYYFLIVSKYPFLTGGGHSLLEVCLQAAPLREGPQGNAPPERLQRVPLLVLEAVELHEVGDDDAHRLARRLVQPASEGQRQHQVR